MPIEGQIGDPLVLKQNIMSLQPDLPNGSWPETGFPFVTFPKTTNNVFSQSPIDLIGQHLAPILAQVAIGFDKDWHDPVITASGGQYVLDNWSIHQTNLRDGLAKFSRGERRFDTEGVPPQIIKEQQTKELLDENINAFAEKLAEYKKSLTEGDQKALEVIRMLPFLCNLVWYRRNPVPSCSNPSKVEIIDAILAGKYEEAKKQALSELKASHLPPDLKLDH